jgi:Enoyl-CoA hydratase/carnithine racemase
VAELVVLRGAAGHFSAGLDLHWLRSLGEIPAVADLQRGLGDFQAAVLAVVRCPVPVLAVVEGTAAGFGLDLALACDLRIASRDASFTSAFARMGLIPDGGSTFTCRDWSGSARRSGSCWPARRSTRRARWPSVWWTRSPTRPSWTRRSRRWPPGSRPGPPPASGPSSAWYGRRRSGRSSRSWRRRVRPSSRPSRGPEFRQRLAAFTARLAARAEGVSPAGEAGTDEIPVFRPDMLAGRVAVVTGGGTGIGLGIASCLAGAGATVAIASRKPEHLEPAAVQLRARGARVSAVETNVREPDAVARMVERVTASTDAWTSW